MKPNVVYMASTAEKSAAVSSCSKPNLQFCFDILITEKPNCKFGETQSYLSALEINCVPYLLYMLLGCRLCFNSAVLLRITVALF